VIGLADEDHGPARVDLEDGHFAVIGPYRSGKSTALAALATSLASSSPNVVLQLLAPRRSPLVELGIWSSVASGADACTEAARLLSESLEAGGLPRTVVVVDDSEELSDEPAATALASVVRRGRDAGVTLVTATERQAAQRAYGWVRDVRKDEHGLFLDPDIDMGDGEMLGVRLPRRTNAAMPPGRGFVVRRGSYALVQIGIT
jgi:S-DNA-T family DNA segregation ATPase FtsK/SpoIIIE